MALLGAVVRFLYLFTLFLIGKAPKPSLKEIFKRDDNAWLGTCTLVIAVVLFLIINQL
jgi:hypothetical protein